ncbi:MAG TPA: SDR family oxidoreductase [Terriglobales bacterium]|nr:SDR family oxidoreductase [Terriglobales bacterium]
MKSGAFAQMLTQMMPLGRPGFPDEIAKAVLFLAYDLASYVSGICLTVDGAQSLRG